MSTLFPSISRSYIEHCQFSSWYPVFSRVSPRATVIRPLGDKFREFLEEDGVVVPEGSEDCPPSTSLSDDSASGSEDDHDVPPRRRYAFPRLDAQIREVIAHYQAVFPKLNWTSPKDAPWILPTMKCTSPADVYLLLKSSDFVVHDLDPSLAFGGCTPCPSDPPASPACNSPHLHELELVLKKWYPIDKGREFRCFVRDETLLGITQRDMNYYPHLNEGAQKQKILASIDHFWVSHIRTKFGGGGDYIFDVHMTRDLSSAHLLDINPYHPKTDSLLFAYDELLELLNLSHSLLADGIPESIANNRRSRTPELRVISSPSDPTLTRNAPANQHNAVPFDVLQMSTGRDVDTFTSHWEEEIRRTLDDVAGYHHEA